MVAASESFADLRTVETRTARRHPGSAARPTRPVAGPTRPLAAPRLRHRGRRRGRHGGPDERHRPDRAAPRADRFRARRPGDGDARRPDCHHPQDPGRLDPGLAAHPGGPMSASPHSATCLLVGTSERRLVAYSAGGVRLWQRGAGRGRARPPRSGSTDRDAVLVDLGGTVRRFALATGAVRWQRGLADDVNRPPAVGAGLVVVADRGGTVTALDAGSGPPRWTADLVASGLLVLAGTVAVVQDQVLHGLDVGTGRDRFVRAYQGGFTDLRAAAGRLALASLEETLIMEPDGSRTRTLPGYLALTAADAHLVGWSADRLDVLDPAGPWSHLAHAVDLPDLQRPAGPGRAGRCLSVRRRPRLDLRRLDDGLTPTRALPLAGTALVAAAALVRRSGGRQGESVGPVCSNRERCTD